MLDEIRSNKEYCIQVIGLLNSSENVLKSAVKLAEYTKNIVVEAEETQDVSKYGSILYEAIEMKRAIPCVYLLLLGMYTWIESLLIKEIQDSN